jgi:hypothetical protein
MLDLFFPIWYTIYRKREEDTTMEKVIRVCEMTGRVTTVADNLTTADAMALVKKLAPTDDFAQYVRIVKD